MSDMRNVSFTKDDPWKSLKKIKLCDHDRLRYNQKRRLYDCFDCGHHFAFGKLDLISGFDLFLAKLYDK